MKLKIQESQYATNGSSKQLSSLSTALQSKFRRLNNPPNFTRNCRECASKLKPLKRKIRDSALCAWYKKLVHCSSTAVVPTKVSTVVFKHLFRLCCLYVFSRNFESRTRLFPENSRPKKEMNRLLAN